MENFLLALVFCSILALVSRALLRRAPRWVWLAAALALAGTSAQAQGVQLEELKATRENDGALVLSVRLSLALPEVVQNALRRGVPVFFEAEAEVLRRHRYWFNRRLARERQHARLAYQPLTRHWLLATSSEPFDEKQAGSGLARSYESLEEALGAIGRMVHWKVASAEKLAKGGRKALRFRFRLDSSRLPRAIQIGAMGPGASGWTLAVQREIPLGRAPQPPALAGSAPQSAASAPQLPAAVLNAATLPASAARAP